MFSVRRAKSSVKIRSTLSSDEPTCQHRKSFDCGEQRVRVISMGANTLQSSEKGKVRETDDPPTQSLTRKSSFWSRKKKNALPATLPVTNDRTVMPSLPLVVSQPLDVDLGAARSITAHNHDLPHSATLSRSFSESSVLHATGSPQQLITSISKEVPKGKRSPRSPSNRPATADPSAIISPRMVSFRPATADASSRNPVRFFSVDPSSPRPDPPPTQPSITIPHHSAPPENLSSSSPAQRRPRAQTNPPLLHRLSANLFSSGPAATTKTSGVFGPNMFTSPAPSSNNSPRPSISKKSIEVPKPQMGEESPDAYLERLLAVVGKAEIAGVLASR